MKIVKNAAGFHDPHMVIMAEWGDFLPSTITINHNGREIIYIEAKKH